MPTLADEVAARQLRDLAEDVRFIVVHPAYREHRRFLSLLFETGLAHYVCFEGQNLSYDQLYQQLGNSLSDSQYLVLDECDRAQPDHLTRLLGQLEHRLGNGRIVIFSRIVPEYIYTNPELRRQSCFIPSDSTLMYPDYAVPDTKQALLEVTALGNGRVCLNGRSIEDWDGTLPRALFFFLVDRGMTTRRQIFETFWPSLTVREATNVFHVTKRKISEVLGFDLTRYWSGFYHISPDINLSYDVAAFSQLVTDSAVASDEKAALLLSRAHSIYRNDFLTSIDMPWTDRRREELFLLYGEVLTSLARLTERSGDHHTALGLYIRASVTNPQREDISRRIMSLYAERNMFNDAEVVYKRLEIELDQKLNVAPSKETQELIGQIRLMADATT